MPVSQQSAGASHPPIPVDAGDGRELSRRAVGGEGASAGKGGGRGQAVGGFLGACWQWLRGGVLLIEPRFGNVIGVALFISLLVFMRSPTSNYIFDEQEALLGNPYLNDPSIPFWDVFKRDFWGLLPQGTIGSYRPLPNIGWRLLWSIAEQPWLLHWLNLLLHGLNAALLSSFIWKVSGERTFCWLAGACFLFCALLTEAVTGVVGLADVLAGTGVLLALHALRLAPYLAPFAIFGATLLGLGAKESALVLIPLITWAAFVLAPVLAPARPRRLLRALLALLGSSSALVGYTYFRRQVFPSPLPDALKEPLAPDATIVEQALRAFLVWFRQPQLPHDPLNNPLIEADFAQRIAGALSVYARGLTQVVFPWRLSGDYSYAEETIPVALVSPGSVAGALLMLAPPSIALVLWARCMRRERRLRRLGQLPTEDHELRGWALLALALVWFPVAYFPHSNIPVLLPTIRAERLWYLPAIGTSIAIGHGLWRIHRRGMLRQLRWPGYVIATFLALQFFQARVHALAYTNDLMFWRANVVAAPASAKAHLNYAVMLGARDRMHERVVFNHQALRLAPDWPMASVYYGDALCRIGRPDRAWRHYDRGFRLAPNQKGLIALGLQCLWDTKKISARRSELDAMVEEYPGTWLAFLAFDIVENGEKYGGVRPEHRPRGYDQKRADVADSSSAGGEGSSDAEGEGDGLEADEALEAPASDSASAATLANGDEEAEAWRAADDSAEATLDSAEDAGFADGDDDGQAWGVAEDQGAVETSDSVSPEQEAQAEEAEADHAQGKEQH